MSRSISLLLAALFLLLASACDNPAGPVEDPNADIPKNPGGPMPEVVNGNLQPSAQVERVADKKNRVRLNLLGMKNPVTGLPIEIEWNETLHVAEDGERQGCIAQELSISNSIRIDLVFVFDNSGSMSAEADNVAAGAAEYAQLLSDSGVNLRVGCVGYSGPVTGALDLSSSEDFVNYLNREYYYGTSRSVGFGGTSGAKLQAAANGFVAGIGGENGVVAMKFADQNFEWRDSALRVYVNFTDEPVQPGGLSEWSTDFICENWTLGQGTVHTVWSGTAHQYLNNYWQPLYYEDPVVLSDCTGGTFIEIASDASNLDLTQLPVTEVILSSYTVEFVSADAKAAHDLELYVRSADGTADGRVLLEGIVYE